MCAGSEKFGLYHNTFFFLVTTTAVPSTKLMWDLSFSQGVVMKSTVLWDITLCSPLKVNRPFGGICHFQLQGRRISHASILLSLLYRAYIYNSIQIKVNFMDSACLPMSLSVLRHIQHFCGFWLFCVVTFPELCSSFPCWVPLAFLRVLVTVVALLRLQPPHAVWDVVYFTEVHRVLKWVNICRYLKVTLLQNYCDFVFLLSKKSLAKICAELGTVYSPFDKCNSNEIL